MSGESKNDSWGSSPGLGSGCSPARDSSFTKLDSLSQTESSADLNQNQMAVTMEGFMEYNDLHKNCRQQLEVLKQEHKSEVSRYIRAHSGMRPFHADARTCQRS